jgi:hypothetical protein
MQTEPYTLLADRLTATGDFHDDQDWRDVVRRVRPNPTRRRALLVLVAVAAVIVPTAIAFGADLRGLFFGRPAPPPVKQTFADGNAIRQQMAEFLKQQKRTRHGQIPPKVDPTRAHGVIAVRTRYGFLNLWAAPAADGRQCWLVGFARNQRGNRAPGSGSCDGQQPPASKIIWSYGWSISEPTLKVLEGHLYVGARTVRVSFPGRKTKLVPVTDRFFLAALPRATKLPTKLQALDAQGHVVAEFVQR